MLAGQVLGLGKWIDRKGGSVSIIDKLLELQDHDLRIHRIQTELKDVPIRKSRELERLKDHTEAMKKAEDALKERQSVLKQNELEVTSKKEKIAKLRTQQMSLKTNKEFQTMAVEIETIEKSIRRDEDGEIEIMETIEAAKADVAARKKELDAEKALVQEDITVLDERIASLDSELKEEQVIRAKLQQDVEPEWLRRYDVMLKSKRGGAVLVSAEGGVCGGCHMTLPPYQQHGARKRVEMVICSYCGRMLY